MNKYFVFLVLLFFQYDVLCEGFYSNESDVYSPTYEIKGGNYVALSKAKKRSRICVSLPHLKDDYWLAVNFGIYQEAKRLGVQVEIYESGGYLNVDYQKRQIKRCVQRGAEAVIVAAVDSVVIGEFSSSIKSKNNVAIVDLVNGMEVDDIDARSMVSFYDMGYMTGKYLVDYIRRNKVRGRVLWFPGPQGAGWVKNSDSGFKDAVSGSSIKVLGTYFGDTGRERQEHLIRSSLNHHEDVDFIVGTSESALAGLSLKRKIPALFNTEIISLYLSTGVYNAISRGHILASMSDNAVLQGRIALDQAVRVLEGSLQIEHASPKIILIDKANISDEKREHMLSPPGYTARLFVR